MLVLLAEDVFRFHTAEGLHELVPDRLGHPAEVFVHGQVDDLSRDLLEFLLHDDGIEREIEAGAARRASGRVGEPGGSAHRAPGTGGVRFFPCDEVEEERLLAMAWCTPKRTALSGSARRTTSEKSRKPFATSS